MHVYLDEDEIRSEALANVLNRDPPRPDTAPSDASPLIFDLVEEEYRRLNAAQWARRLRVQRSAREFSAHITDDY